MIGEVTLMVLAFALGWGQHLAALYAVQWLQASGMLTSLLR